MKSLYNRYIPQSDGSFQRNRIQDTKSQIHQKAEEIKHQHNSGHPPGSDSPPPVSPSFHEKSAGSFLKHLLPKNFDTEDLLIVLLLLLMAGDCEEEKGNALLTLALYFLL